MNNANASKRIHTGLTVVFTDDALEFFPSATGVIFEVRDSRLLGGEYVFSLAPVQEPPAWNCTHIGICADDLQPFG